MKIRLPLLLPLLLTSCISSGPKVERKKPLENLSGESYSSGNLILGVPIVERKKGRSTTILGQLDTGKAFCDRENVMELSLENAKRVLLEKTMSACGGTFTFKGDYENGTYFVKSLHSNRKGEKQFAIDDYTVNVTLKINP